MTRSEANRVLKRCLRNPKCRPDGLDPGKLWALSADVRRALAIFLSRKEGAVPLALLRGDEWRQWASAGFWCVWDDGAVRWLTSTEKVARLEYDRVASRRERSLVGPPEPSEKQRRDERPEGGEYFAVPFGRMTRPLCSSSP